MVQAFLALGSVLLLAAAIFGVPMAVEEGGGWKRRVTAGTKATLLAASVVIVLMFIAYVLCPECAFGD